MKINWIHPDNLIFIVWVFSTVSVVFNIKVNNILDLDMIFVMFIITLRVLFHDKVEEIWIENDKNRNPNSRREY